jgi:nuclear pore complex protein Nup155
MLKKAVDPNEKIPLAQRIECLTRAANSYSSASNSKAYLPSSNLMQSIGGYNPAQDRLLKERQVSDASLKANINEIQDKLDVASIQQRVLTTVEQSQNVDLDAEKLSALGFELLSPTDLYNEYACPLSLFDVCLLIMNTCHTNQSDTIETLWKSVICEETIPCQTTSALAVSFLTQLKQGSTLEDETVMQSGDYGNNLQSFDDGEWIPRLRNRVSTLGKELYGKGADYTVPLDLIVQALEGLRQAYNEIHKENQLSNPWPIETILSIGFSFDALYRSYDSLYLEADGDINWLASILELLKIWVNDAFNYDSLPAGSVGSSASSQLAQAVKNGGLIDRIRTYIAALDGMDGAIIDELKIGFSEVEDAIRKGF